MAKGRDFISQLIADGVISPDQANEAKRVARTSNKKLHEVFSNLGYAPADVVMRAVAKELGLDFINLHEVRLPPSVVELVPESVARENAILPMDPNDSDGTLKVIVCDPWDLDTIDKLRFILNCKVEVAVASKESIVEAINKHYGQQEDQSADSMLQEFTDTAIDFTETEGG